MWGHLDERYVLVEHRDLTATVFFSIPFVPFYLILTLITLLPPVSLVPSDPWCSFALSDSRFGVHRCRYAARPSQTRRQLSRSGRAPRVSLFLHFCFPLPCTIPRSLVLRCSVRCCGKGLRGRSQDSSLRTTFHGLFQSPSLSPSASRRGQSVRPSLRDFYARLPTHLRMRSGTRGCNACPH